MKSVRAGALALMFAGACAGQQKVADEKPGDDQVGGGTKVDALADVRKAKPGTPGAAQARKIDAGEKEDFEKAVATYQRLKKSGAIKGGDCEDAAEAFQKAADRHANLVEARYNQGAVLLECGKKDEAVRAWERLTTGPKPYTPALTNLGFIAYEKGEVDKAESLFDRAVQLDPQLNSIPARLNLAMILRDKARRSGGVETRRDLNEKATTHLRSVLALDGNSLQAYASLCYIYFDLGLYDAAQLVGRQAIMRAQEIATGKSIEEITADEAPADDKGKKGKGKKERGSDEPKTLKEVGSGQGTGYTPEMKKHLGMVHNTLGLVWLKKKNVSEAIASFKRAVEQDPELYEARMNWSALALNFRDYSSAEQNLRAVLQAQPKNYDAAIGLGVALRGQKKVEEAEQQYVAAQKLDPQNPDAYFNLGVLYQEYKGSDKPSLQKAQQYYRDFLTRAPTNGKRREVEKRIKDIDDMFIALEEAAKLQKEAEELQRKAEEQQRKAEEEAKKQGAAGAPAEPAETAAAK
jgi:tetratricopeptide (TPR) repeat protein